MLVTPLLLSPLALWHKAARGPASVGVVAFPVQDYAAQLQGDSDLQNSFDAYSRIFGQASLNYFQGVQAAHSAYGLKGGMFNEVAPIQVKAFNLFAPSGFFQTGVWQGFSQPSASVIYGNAVGEKSYNPQQAMGAQVIPQVVRLGSGR